MAIRIDLRTGIPKVRKVLDKLEPGNCHYDAPCVIGAMVGPVAQFHMEYNDLDDQMISTLLGSGLVRAPKAQHKDMGALQAAFDDGDREWFVSEFERIAAKYEVQADA